MENEKKMDYIEVEYRKILAEKGDETLNYAMATAWVLGYFKGINLKIIDMRGRSTLVDFFILASATNSTQARAMAEKCAELFRHTKQKVTSLEGMMEADWILIDSAGIMVHIFQEVSRDIYDLDTLWGTAPTIDIPAEYYFSGTEDVQKPINMRDYF
jgi:ribosome-associated protein